MGRDRRSAFAVTVLFELADGVYEQFHSLVSDNARQSVERESGCLRFDVLSASDQPESAQVFLYEIYTDKAAFDEHLASSHFQAFDAKSRELVRKKTVFSYSVDQNFKEPTTR